MTIFLTGAGMSATKGSPAKSGWSGGGMLKFFFIYIFVLTTQNSVLNSTENEIRS